MSKISLENFQIPKLIRLQLNSQSIHAVEMSDASRAIRALLCSAVRPLLPQNPLHPWSPSRPPECKK